MSPFKIHKTKSMEGWILNYNNTCKDVRKTTELPTFTFYFNDLKIISIVSIFENRNNFTTKDK